MLETDTPLDDLSCDRLNRTAFSFTFAQALVKAELGANGFVAAITGAWGSGKSTTINFICHFVELLQILDHYRLVSGDQLANIEQIKQIHTSFLLYKDTLNKHIKNGKNPYLANYNFIENEIKDSGVPDHLARSVYNLIIAMEREKLQRKIHIIRFSPWSITGQSEITMSLMTDIGSIISENFGKKTREYFLSYLERACEVFYASGLDNGIAKSAFTILSKRAKKTTLTLEETKSLLTKELLSTKNKNKKIIVTIDDLDRLTPYEASEIINAIKGIANLPNIIYILSYEKNKFESLISRNIYNEENAQLGEKFLEKIIQYSKSLPFDNNKHQEIFEEKILKILEKNSIRPDINRLSDAWTYIISQYISTPRDITRLANNYFVALSALKEITDHCDLLIITTLETFDFKVYQTMKEIAHTIGWSIYHGTHAHILEKALESNNNKELAKKSIYFLTRHNQLINHQDTTQDFNASYPHNKLFRKDDNCKNYFDLDPQPQQYITSSLDELIKSYQPNGEVTNLIKSIGKEEIYIIRNTIEKIYSLSNIHPTPVSSAWLLEMSEIYSYLVSEPLESETKLARPLHLLIEDTVVNWINRGSVYDDALSVFIDESRDLSLACRLAQLALPNTTELEFHTSAKALNIKQKQLLLRQSILSIENKTILNSSSPLDIVIFCILTDDDFEKIDFSTPFTMMLKSDEYFSKFLRIISKNERHIHYTLRAEYLYKNYDNFSLFNSIEKLSNSNTEEHRKVATKLLDTVTKFGNANN